MFVGVDAGFVCRAQTGTARIRNATHLRENISEDDWATLVYDTMADSGSAEYASLYALIDQLVYADPILVRCKRRVV